MDYDPFKMLRIDPTLDEEAIEEAYENAKAELNSSGQLWHLKVAYQNCLLYAQSGGDESLFKNEHLN